MFQLANSAHGLNVVAQSASFRLPAIDYNLQSAREQLGASHLLEGSVLRSKDRVRVRVSLSGLRSLALLWNQTYTAAFTDLIHLQDEVAKTVAHKISGEMDLPASVNISADAYDAFLKAKHLMSTRNIRQAVAAAHESLELDQKNPYAHTMLADYYITMNRTGVERGYDTLELAEEHTRSALLIDPGHLDARYLQAYLSLLKDNQLAEAFEKISMLAGEHPRHRNTDYLALLYRYGRRYSDATGVYHHVLSLDPLDTSSAFSLAQIYGMQGDQRNAALAFDAVDRTVRDHPGVIQYQLNTAIRNGELNDVKELLRSFSALVPPSDARLWEVL